MPIRHTSGPKFYPVLDTPAALGWLGQVSALEVHVPQWRITATNLESVAGFGDGDPAVPKPDQR